MSDDELRVEVGTLLGFYGAEAAAFASSAAREHAADGNADLALEWRSIAAAIRRESPRPRGSDRQ